MADARSPSGGQRRQLILVLCCVLAVATGGALVATVGSGGLAGSPVDTLLPGEDAATEDSSGNGAGGAGGAGGGLGALNPTNASGVGGDIGLDNSTFGSTDTEIHFTAWSSEPTYWRTGTYENYTGEGWARNLTTHPYDEPLTHDGTTGPRIDFNLTLAQPATAVPTPWRPTAIAGVDELSVGGDGTLIPQTQLGEETTLSGVSHAPDATPDVLRAVGDTHPEEIDPFTESNSSERLAEKTEEITTDAETRYDAAMAVQDWLRTEKDYSLDAYEQSDDIADTFVFEMGAGYCEYFATAMAEMLRTQDIPTRYVVGYSSGQAVGNNTYEVRAMNAHAWVEVYFDGIGWVQFDPTPGDSRLQAQQDALAEEGESYDIEEPGSPGETFQSNETDNGDIDPAPGNGGEEGYAVSFDSTPTPGETVTITVTEDGDEAPFVAVEINNESVGITDGNGTVTATVPEAESFTIAVREPTVITDFDADFESIAASGSSSTGSGQAPDLTVDTADGEFNPLVFNDDEWALPDPEAGEVVHEETIEVDTHAEITVSGETLPGNEITVTAMNGGRPVIGATVRIDGESVAETGIDGRATVTVPEQPGTAILDVESGILTGETELTVPELSVDVEPDLPLALPFGTATVEATFDNSSAVGALVEVDGRPVAMTDANGEATVALPASGTAEISVSQYDARTTTTVDGLFTNVGLIVGGVALVGLLIVGALVVGGYRSGAAIISLPRQVGHALATLPQRVVWALVSLTSDTSTVVTRLTAALQSALVILGVREPTVEPHENAETPLGDPTEVRSEDHAAIRDAWAEFCTSVSAPAATQTPGELAAHAIAEDGLPAEPVRSLLSAFRAVEYGDRPASELRERAETAASEIAVAASTPESDVNPPKSRDGKTFASDGGYHIETDDGSAVEPVAEHGENDE